MCRSNIVCLLWSLSLTIVIITDGVILSNRPYCEIFASNFNYNYSYNFSKLSRHLEDIVIHNSLPSETIRMQLCSPLIKKCNGKDGYGICLIKDNKEIGIGKVPPTIKNDLGLIQFIFTGDTCKLNINYKVIVIMKCNYLEIGNTQPELFVHSENQCDLHMIWQTEFACIPRTTTNCTVEDHGSHYDLSPLTSYSDNYVIRTGNRQPLSIILNICHSIIYEYNALCQPKSGACLRNSTNPSNISYLNLGDVEKPPFFENGQLKLEYQYGYICKTQNVPHVKTTISFKCDYHATNTVPEYIKGSNECHYQLLWRTIAACSTESLHNYTTATAGTCTVINPLTNFKYDLQPLMKKDYNIMAQNDVEYRFSICNPNVNNICKSGTGVCLINNGTSVGKANTNLMLQQGGPYLNYTEGDSCGADQKRYTIIAFFCGSEGSQDGPIIIEDHPCHLIIHWNTNIVCEKKVKCATQNDEINLTPLIQSVNNYAMKLNNTQFYINICRSLIPTPGLTCAHGSAICKASLNLNNELTEGVSLGFLEESPVMNENQQAVLRYTGGSTCPEVPDTAISTNITFICDYNVQALPVFRWYINCTYVFEWKTRIVCGALMGNWVQPCTIRNQLLSHECDLSLLHEKENTYQVRRKQGKEYNIRICGGIKDCGSSVVCQGNNGYGSVASVVFDYRQNVTKLNYANGSYTSEIRLKCNESAGIGQPMVLWETNYSVGFEWQTNVTCALRSTAGEQRSVDPSDERANGFPSSHVGTVAGVVFTIVILVAAFVYFRNPDKRLCLRSCFNSSARRSDGRVQYCRVDTTEEARFLLDASDPTQCQSDSDDDLLGA